MKKRIFVLNGHPAARSLNRTLAETYASAARAAGHEVRLSHIGEMEFDLDYGFAGYAESKPLESALEGLLTDIEWSEHVVITAPMWWGSLPARLKGAIDRAFLPGRTFDTRVPAGKMPKPMLSGRSARLILTADTPKWFLSLVYSSPIIHQLRGHILRFVGITPARVTYFAGASHPKKGRVERWIGKIERLGLSAG